MPPRCAAVRNRVGLNPVQPQDGIWITDIMLREAIERYNRLTAKSHHSISSYHGPMESRRRLGKRHMTALMPESHSTPPPWFMEFPLRLDEWKWEPPNTPEDRIRNRNKLSLGRLLDRSIEWLENFGDEATSQHVPAQTSITEAPPTKSSMTIQPDLHGNEMLNRVSKESVNMESTSTAIDGTGLVDTHTARTEAIDLGRIESISDCSKELTQLNERLGALDQSNINERSLWIACKPLTEYLKSAIPQKIVSGSDLQATLQPFTSATKASLNDELLATAEARIGNLILRTLQESNQMRTCPVSFWVSSVALLKQMDKKQIATYLYFSRLAKAAQINGKGWLRHSLVADTLASAVEFLATLPVSHKHTVKYHTIVIAAVKELGNTRPALLWERVMDLLAQHYTGEQLNNLQRQVALLMSFDSRAQISQCLKAYPGTWNSEDSFLFTIGRAWSSGCLPAGSIPAFLQLQVNDRNWSHLVSHIHAARPQKRTTLFRHLYQATEKTGQFRMMAEHLIERMGWNSHRDSMILRNIAIASGDYRQALNLWRMANLWLGPKYVTSEWDWTAWAPYMEKMIKDPGIGDSIIWRVLAMHKGLANEARPGTAPHGIKTATELLELMGNWFLEASHLNDRQTRRRITQCIATCQAINNSLTPQMLLCLVELIFRDSEYKQMWSRSELEWMSKLISHNMKDEQARQVLVQLHGWQWTIRNQAVKQQRVRPKQAQEEPSQDAQGNGNLQATQEHESVSGLNKDSVEAFRKRLLSQHAKLNNPRSNQSWKQKDQGFAEFETPDDKPVRESWNKGWVPWQILQRNSYAARMGTEMENDTIDDSDKWETMEPEVSRIRKEDAVGSSAC